MPSAGQILLETILPEVLNVALPILAVAAVALWMLGRASLRMLQDAHEEIPHREEMQWGARWYWAVMAAGIAVPIAATLAALTSTTYPLTVAVLGALAIGPIGFVLHAALPWQLQGAFLWLARWRAEEDETVPELIERQRARAQSQWARRLQGGIAVLHMAMMIWAGITTVPLDQRLMQHERAERLGAQIAEGIGSEQIIGAHVILDGMLPNAPGNRVLIEVTEKTPEATVERIAAAAEPHMRHLLPPGEWIVSAWSEDGGNAKRVVTVRPTESSDI